MILPTRVRPAYAPLPTLRKMHSAMATQFARAAGRLSCAHPPCKPAPQRRAPSQPPVAEILDQHQRGRRDDQGENGSKSQTEYHRGRKIDPPLGGGRADRDLARE